MHLYSRSGVTNAHGRIVFLGDWIGWSRQCEQFARRLEKCHGVRLDEQVRDAIELAYSRAAASDEVELLSDYAARYGLANMCRLIVNSNEFLYVN